MRLRHYARATQALAFAPKFSGLMHAVPVQVIRRRAVLTLIAVPLGVGACNSGSLPEPPPAVGRPETWLSQAGDRLEVHCDGRTTTLLQPAVTARKRGVLVQVSGEGAGQGLYLTYGWRGQPRGGEPVGTDGQVTLVLPPGTSEVACQASGRDPTPPQQVHVLDPAGLWLERGPIEDALDCGTPAVVGSTVAGRGSTATAAASDYARLVQAELGERGSGYPDQSPQEFVLLQDGKPVGTTQAFRTEGSWQAAANYACS